MSISPRKKQPSKCLGFCLFLLFHFVGWWRFLSDPNSWSGDKFSTALMMGCEMVFWDKIHNSFLCHCCVLFWLFIVNKYRWKTMSSALQVLGSKFHSLLSVIWWCIQIGIKLVWLWTLFLLWTFSVSRCQWGRHYWYELSSLNSWMSGRQGSAQSGLFETATLVSSVSNSWAQVLPPQLLGLQVSTISQSLLFTQSSDWISGGSLM